MENVISKNELEAERKPTALKEYCDHLFEEIRAKRDSAKQARLRKDVYKELIAELYPLSIFCSWKFPRDDVTVRLILGNQGYDAIIRDDCGKEIRYIEVTWPIDGQKMHRQAIQLNEKGGTDIEDCDPLDKAKVVMARVLEVAKKKAHTDYRGLEGASLLIVISVAPYFYFDQPDHVAVFDEFINELKTINYLVDSVYLLLMPNKQVVPIIES